MKQIVTQLTVKDLLHHSQLGHNLWQLYQGGILFDVSILSSDGIKLRAHWVVLCGASEVFRSMMGTTNIKSQLVLMDIPSDILGLIIKYLYTGEINVASNNYLRLIEVAKAQKLYRLAELIEQKFASLVEKEANVERVMKVEPGDEDEPSNPTEAHHSADELEKCVPVCQSVVVKVEPGYSEAKKAVVVNRGLMLRRVDADKLKTLNASIKAGTIQPIIVKRPGSHVNDLSRSSSSSSIIQSRQTSLIAKSCSQTSLITGSEKQIYMPAHMSLQEKLASSKGQTSCLVNDVSQVRQSFLPGCSASNRKQTSLLLDASSKDRQHSSSYESLRSLLVKTATDGKQISQLVYSNCKGKTGPDRAKPDLKEKEYSPLDASSQEKHTSLLVSGDSEQSSLLVDEDCPTSDHVDEPCQSRSGVNMNKTRDVEVTAENTVKEASYESMIEVDHALGQCEPFFIKSASLNEHFSRSVESVCDERLKYFYKRPAMKTALRLVKWYRRRFYANLIRKEKEKKKKKEKAKKKEREKEILWCGTCKKPFRSKSALRAHSEFVSCMLKKKRTGAAESTDLHRGWERKRVYRPRKNEVSLSDWQEIKEMKRRKRGRPSKKEVSHCPTDPACLADAQDTVERKRRKRGRPRKLDKPDDTNNSALPIDLRLVEFIHCPECDDMYTQVDLLRQHLADQHTYTDEQMEQHLSSRYQCLVEGCRYQGKNVKYLREHMAARHPDIQYDCPHCHRHFRVKDSLQQHIKLFHDPAIREKYLFPCTACNKSFMSVREKQVHEKVEHGVDHPIEMLMCSVEGCDVRTGSEKQLNQHMTSCHAVTFPFSCSICGRPYRTKPGLKKHMQNHEDPMYLCQVCGKSFRVKHSLDQHTKHQHQQEAPLNCDQCTTFKTHTRRSLANHMYHKHRIKASFDSRPILYCDQCPNYSTINATRMNRHINSAHSEIRKFSCEVCAKGFKSNWELTLHKQVHAVSKSHSCPECSFSSKFRGTLDKHIKKQHWFHDYKPYLCVYCEFGSNMMAKVRNHVRQTHPGREVTVQTDHNVKEQMKIIMLEKKRE